MLPPASEPSVAGVKPDRSGVAAAVAAFFLWGILPVFWKQLSFLTPATIVAQRNLWSLVVLLALAVGRHEFGSLSRCLRDRKILAASIVAGLLLAANWLLYIWATLNGRILEGALGYYLNPFFNMLFGFLWFGERHNRRQQIAIILALSGVIFQLPAAGHFPWVSITLALTFALYAVVKKRVPMNSSQGLTLEATVLAPFALGYLFLTSNSPSEAFGNTPGNLIWVMASGLATTVPLLFFGHAVRHIRLSTLGILQFIGPTLQFLIGYACYGEPLPASKLASFGLIWVAVGLYAWDARLRTRS